ncbi:MAG: response regulator [Candidatus Omnitrophica bacterium]|nr:response regulator [Candidatus Omnitrophota bacterium]
MNNHKTKIAVIDDDKDIVFLMQRRLRKENFLVSFAYSGRAGLEVISRENPALIILDLGLPDMDGRDVLTNLKRNKSTKDIPVIILTGKDEQIERDYGMELGAYEYITKPYDGDYLVRIINRVLDKRKRGEN